MLINNRTTGNKVGVPSTKERKVPSISLNIKQAVEASGLSRSALYVALKAGSLTARKAGRRTVILTEDLDAYVRGLPKMEAAGNG